MNEQQLAAVKQAVESMTDADRLLEDEGYGRAYQQEAITALQSIISQDALHKMAEESRTSGLRLDDWDKIGCVNHDCDKCKAVQEPVESWEELHNALQRIDTAAVGLPTFEVHHEGGLDAVVQNIVDAIVALHEMPAPQPVPVKTYHDGKPWPVAPKPWVGLTDEDKEFIELTGGKSDVLLAELVEAKLKEKNT